MSETKLSENIGTYEAGEYIVTAAIWRVFSDVANGYGDTFEIGIRRKSTGHFWLMQGNWNHQSVQDVANAVAMLLGDKTQCYSPEWCREHFQ